MLKGWVEHRYAIISLKGKELYNFLITSTFYKTSMSSGGFLYLSYVTGSLLLKLPTHFSTKRLVYRD